ncbi:glycosyltransferase family 4 protein [Vibrio crassostreae]|uniref:glycosyltransferase family 4 protein n=1 Tax=Vibrio crassostreae TaxID=246167 RepID=UPI001301D5A5|nr:glycosyltransferase family 4 protein [Vibrio crassostreae]
MKFYNPENIFSKVVIVSLSDSNYINTVEGMTIINIDVKNSNSILDYAKHMVGLNNRIIANIIAQLKVTDVGHVDVVIQRFGSPLYHGLYAMILSKKLNTKMVSTVQSLYSKVKPSSSIKNKILNKAERFVEREVYKSSDKIILVSKFVSDEVENNREKSVVIPNKINDDLIGDSTEENFILKTDKYFLSVGRLIEQKNYERMLNAYTLYKRSGGVLKYIIVGDGIKKESLNTIIENNGLKDSVIIYDIYLDFSMLKILFRDASALFFCSNIEGQGRVVYESLLHGCPVICSEYGPMKEMVVHKKTGYVVNHKDLTQMKSALFFSEGDMFKKDDCRVDGSRYLTSFVNKQEADFYAKLLNL